MQVIARLRHCQALTLLMVVACFPPVEKGVLVDMDVCLFFQLPAGPKKKSQRFKQQGFRELRAEREI